MNLLNFLDRLYGTLIIICGLMCVNGINRLSTKGEKITNYRKNEEKRLNEIYRQPTKVKNNIITDNRRVDSRAPTH